MSFFTGQSLKMEVSHLQTLTYTAYLGKYSTLAYPGMHTQPT